MIDINKVDNDTLEEHISPENEWAKEMLDRICKETMGISAQELYIRWILLEIKYLQENANDANSIDKLLKYLKEIDNIMGYSKDKRDVKITTSLKSMSDIYNATNL